MCTSLHESQPTRPWLKHQLYIDFKKAYDSDRREVMCTTLIQFRITKKLVTLITICMTMMSSTVCIGEHLSDAFPFCNGL